MRFQVEELPVYITTKVCRGCFHLLEVIGVTVAELKQNQHASSLYRKVELSCPRKRYPEVFRWLWEAPGGGSEKRVSSFIVTRGR